MKNIKEKINFHSLFYIILPILIVFLYYCSHLFVNFFSFIVKSFVLLDFNLAAGLLSDISLLLIGSTVTIFVFSVTLLGNAAKILKEKKVNAEQKAKDEFDKDIATLQEETSKIKDPEDERLKKLKEQIEDLETKKKYNKDEITQIEKKYESMSLKNGVALPVSLFLVSLIFENWIIIFSNNIIYQCVSFIFGFLFLFLGIKQLYLILSVVQEIAINAKDQIYEQLHDSLIDALKTVDEEKEPKPFIVFTEKPPFILKSNTETEIEFTVDLKIPGNKEAKNVEAWFLTSPEIEILKSSNYDEPFSQNDSYVIPNANTVIYKFGLVKKHVVSKGKIKIKTTISGSFKLKYKVNCDNHVESTTDDKEVGIIVQ